jgi:3-oxoacyl-[acyl-carrier protein] reductase
MKGLDGKVALVTGGGRGLGRHLALALAARGVKLVVTGRNEKALGETVGEIAYGGGKARHLVGDVRDPSHLAAAVVRAVEVFGTIDFAVAAAGKVARVELGADAKRADEILATNLMGVYYTFEAAVVRMKGPGRLLVANVRDGVWDRAEDTPGYAAYASSKAGLLGLVRRSAYELAPRRITCNAIIAGSEETFDRVAELGAFLCSSSGDGMTGQAIAITG